MSRYDGLIIPRSYSEYINKTDAATLLQALQQSGVMDAAPTSGSNHPVKSSGVFTAAAAIAASDTTITGAAITAGAIVRVFFSTDINGSNATTGLNLTYNGNAYAVKVGKNGALANFSAYEVESGVFKYLQAYTTLELIFDGTQFIIIGNPVVLSSAGYTIYADGKSSINKTHIQITPSIQVHSFISNVCRIDNIAHVSIGISISGTIPADTLMAEGLPIAEGMTQCLSIYEDNTNISNFAYIGANTGNLKNRLPLTSGYYEIFGTYIVK